MTAMSLMLLWSACCGTSAEVTATTVEGKTLRGGWGGITTDGAILLKSPEGEQHLRQPDLLTLVWPVPTTTSRPATEVPAMVWLRDGSRLPGRIITGDARQIELDTERGRVSLVLGELAAVRFTAHDKLESGKAFDEAMATPDSSQDTLLVVVGDKVNTLRGAVESLDPEVGSFRWRQRSVPVRADRVLGVVFGAGLSGPKPAPVCCTLRDGAIWCGELAGGDMEALRLRRPDGMVSKLAVNEIVEVRFHSGRVTFLDTLEPAEYTFEPFGITEWPWRRNRSAANRSLRIGGLSFERGIGMHSQATLQYDLRENFAAFAAVIGIDDAVGSQGNAVFVVRADDREIFNSGPVTGADEPRSILVPIDGPRRLELRVEFGEDLDVGDQANWCDARLISKQ